MEDAIRPIRVPIDISLIYIITLVNQSLIYMIKHQSNPSFSKRQKEEVRLTMEDAIRLIQVHERARQGRLRAKFMREIRMQEEREKMAANRGAPTMDPDVAAVHIQRVSAVQNVHFRRIVVRMDMFMLLTL